MSKLLLKKYYAETKKNTASLAEKAQQTDLLSEVTNRTNAVSTEKAERQSEIAVERARITAIGTLTQGSTTGDAELIDARTSAEGITFANAGSAVRSVQSDVINLKTLGLVIPNNIQNGRWGTGAAFVSSTSWYALSYLVTANKKYYISGYTLIDITYRIFLMNGSGGVVQTLDTYQAQPLVNYEITIPNGVTEMRITVEKVTGRVFHVRTNGTDKFSDKVNNVKTLSDNIISNGKVSPTQRNSSYRWGSDGSLVSISGFNAYKFSVLPNKKYYIKGYTLKDITSRILFVDSAGLISYYDNYYSQPLLYKEITIPEGIIEMRITETDSGDGTLSVFDSTINSKMNGLIELKKDGIVTPVIKNTDYRWGSDGSLISIAGFNAYKFSVEAGYTYYIKGYTLEDLTSRILFVKSDTTIVKYEIFQSQPLDFYSITMPYDVVEMRITETDKGSDNLEVYSTGLIKKTLGFVNNIFEANSDYPSYYESNISSAISRYQLAKYYINNCDSFAFLTDLHFKDNQMHSVGLIKHFAENTDLANVFCGGDIVYAYGTTDECKNNGYEHVKYFAKFKGLVDYCCIRGNHDYTIKHTVEGTTGYTAPFGFIYNIVMSNVTDKSSQQSQKLYYYLDNLAKKVRYVFVDTNDAPQSSEDTPWGLGYGISSEQINWLVNTALVFSETGWSVIVIGHMSCVTEITGYNNTLDSLAIILKAYKNKQVCEYKDFTTANAEMVAYICGHNHKDENATVNGLLFVSTGCDSSIQDDIFTRTKGTDTEQLIDIFIIDKDNKQLKTIRIGAGNDRVFNY